MNKHDANIKKGKLINFQIGIIAIICFCYVMYEVSHYAPIIKKKTETVQIEDLYYESMGPVVAYSEPIIANPKVIEKPISKPVKIKVAPIVKIEEVDNTTKIETTEEKAITTEETKPITKLKATKTTSSTLKSPITSSSKNTIHNTETVDMLPVFPGCDKYSSNDERAVCFQDKIQRMINKKFDRNIGYELGISGKQQILLYFEINKNGEVTNIKARSKHPEFITEAKRVAGLLPKMEPAIRKGNKVKMAYNIPIVFKTYN